MTENKSVLCRFYDLEEEMKEYFLECLKHDDLTIYSALVDGTESVDMVCTFCCLDGFLSSIVGGKNIYVPKPPTDVIGIETILSDKDSLWCTAYGIYANTLIKIDKKTMDIEMLMMPYDSIKKDRLFCKILKINDCVYLIPENSDFIAIYNVDEEKWTKIDITEEGVDGWYYSDAIEVSGFVYLMPNKAKKIIKINCNNFDVEFFQLNSFDCFSFLEVFDRRYEFCGGGALANIRSYIYIYSRLYNCFLKYDTENNTLDVIRKLDKENFSYACVFYNDCFWMFTMSGHNRIIKYDIKNDELIYFDNLPSMAYNRAPFHKGTSIDEKIIFVPGLAENVIEIDTISHEVHILGNFNIETYDGSKECWIYSDVDSDDSFVYLFETHLKEFVRYDVKNNKSEKIEIHLTKKAWYRGEAKKIQQMVLDKIESPKMDALVYEE